MDLKGRVCLVTGATSGIGRATALALASRGGRVVAVGRRAEALAAVGASVHQVLAADLRDTPALKGIIPQVLERHGRVDVLVNGAGIGRLGPLQTVSHDVLQDVVETDLLAPMWLCREALESMLARGGGHIVNIASIVGFTGNREEAVYAAAKAGLVGFTRSLQQELAGSPVVVTLVAPGVVDTPFFDRRGVPYTRRWPRPIPPDRVAGALVAAIASNRAEVFVPGWLRMAARVNGVAPSLYRALARRWG